MRKLQVLHADSCNERWQNARLSHRCAKIHSDNFNHGRNQQCGVSALSTVPVTVAPAFAETVRLSGFETAPGRARLRRPATRTYACCRFVQCSRPPGCAPSHRPCFCVFLSLCVFVSLYLCLFASLSQRFSSAIAPVRLQHDCASCVACTRRVGVGEECVCAFHPGRHAK